MLKSVTMLVAAALLSGCAALNQVTSDVSTYSQWPAERRPGSYAFERLPSQQARPDAQQQLEDAARRAIEGAGFTPAADVKSAEYVVQVGARVSADDRFLYPDPVWWRASLYHGRRWPGHWGTGFGFGYTGSVSYEREAALLIRDRQSGQPLYEARAVNDGPSPSITSLLPALFDAAMKDFPSTGVNPRRVTTELVAP
jgi:hypothetical protein